MPLHRSCIAFIFLGLLSCATAPSLRQAPDLAVVPEEGVQLEGMFGPVEVVQEGTVRQLVFVDDEGLGTVQSEMDVLEPGALQTGYTRAMFASTFVVPEPSRVLIVGLGGGAMVRFLQTHAPEVEIDAVEIDPVVVEVADRYFGARAGERTRIHCADAFDFLARGGERWDVIYMDAFIQPGEGTDASGAPLHLGTAAFLRGLGERVTEGGVVVFNLVDADNLEVQLAGVEAAFPAVWRFQVPGASNTVVVASPRGLPAGGPDRVVGRRVDARWRANFRVEALVEAWVRP